MAIFLVGEFDAQDHARWRESLTAHLPVGETFICLATITIPLRSTWRLSLIRRRARLPVSKIFD